MSTKNHNSLGLILLDDDPSKILEEMRQCAVLAHGHPRDIIHLHHGRGMGKEERRYLRRGGRESMECLKPFVSRLGGGYGHWYGRMDDGGCRRPIQANRWEGTIVGARGI